MKFEIILLIIFLLPFASSSYGDNLFGDNIFTGLFCGDDICNSEDIYTETCSSCSLDCRACPVSTSGSSSGTSAKTYYCQKDITCTDANNKFCWKNKCLNFFQIQVSNISASVKSGEQLHFDYSILSLDDINETLQVYYGIKHEGEIITNGTGMLCIDKLGKNFGEGSLFVCDEMHSGNCTLFIKAVLGTRTFIFEKEMEFEVSRPWFKLTGDKKIDYLIYFLLIGILLVGIILIYLIKTKNIFRSIKKKSEKFISFMEE